ncbi:MAG TPA: hypothetical protein PKN13_06405 [Accumulibacter sp.]|nr:hypothetical protein [Accumulibacter sp.]
MTGKWAIENPHLHPQDLSARKLLGMMPLPECWDEQRRLLGMND